MINHASAAMACQSRARGVTVATTGAIALAATTTGYTRSDAGSFITDGFAPGMELTPSGFASNPTDVIASVAASTITVRSTRIAEASNAGRSLVVGLPAQRAWENLNLKPVAQRPYIEDRFVPATSRGISIPVTTGTIEETGLYVLTYYGVPNTGPLGIRRVMDALLALFTPGTTIATDAGDVLRVRSDVGPSLSQLLPIDGGWTCCTLTVPWRAWSTNQVAA